MEIWIVGRVTKSGLFGKSLNWEFQGAYENKEDAIASCKNASWFIGPTDLNTAWPEEPTEWEGSFYPIERTRKEFFKKYPLWYILLWFKREL